MTFNYDEEVICNHLVTTETKKLWAIEMDLAQKLLDVCKKNQLQIWAEAGTLLGAVRHQGFIPWDDDMDFCMMRPDYEKLLQVGPKEFKEPYFFQSIYTDNFWGGMAKLRKSDTAMIESDYMFHQNFNRGIFIDIFPLDAVPDDFTEFKKRYNKVKLLRRIIKNYKKQNPQKLNLKAKMNHYAIKAMGVFGGVNFLEHRVNHHLTCNKIEDNKDVSIWDFFALEQLDISKVIRRPKDCYSDTIFLPFYNMLIPAPIKYHEVLTSWYGDYMKPVKGTQLHNNGVIDCERSYEIVLDELRNRDKKA